MNGGKRRANEEEPVHNGCYRIYGGLFSIGSFHLISSYRPYTKRSQSPTIKMMVGAKPVVPSQLFHRFRGGASRSWRSSSVAPPQTGRAMVSYRFCFRFENKIKTETSSWDHIRLKFELGSAISESLLGFTWFRPFMMAIVLIVVSQLCSFQVIWAHKIDAFLIQTELPRYLIWSTLMLVRNGRIFLCPTRSPELQCKMCWLCLSKKGAGGND